MFDLPVVAPGVAIYDHLRRHAGEAGRTLDELPLPDDDKDRPWYGWAPGCWDGSARQRGRTDDTDRARHLAGLLSSACRQPSVSNLRALYDAMADGDSLIGCVYALTEPLAAEQPDQRALHAIGHWLATTASHREPIKLGVTLLGRTGSDADLPVLRLLGAHSEFTLYCVTAMAHILPDPEPELWALARPLEGEGRIVCVERLRATADPRIRDWILRGGFRNLNGSEQLALIAATTGDLRSALRGDADRELLTAAGEIIQDLISCEDIDDYEDGADAVEAFLGHMRTRADTVQDVSTVAEIRSFLTDDDRWESRWDDGPLRHWTATRRAALADTCRLVLGWDKWPERITAALAGPDENVAIGAARALDVDIFDILVEKIRADPYTNVWYDAWLQADTERAGQLADMARTLLPIDRIATGPADEEGIGPAWRPHRALGWTVTALRDHPGIGADLLIAALRAPLNLDRQTALYALWEWPPHTWARGVAAAVEEVARADPNEDIRRFAARVLRGPSTPVFHSGPS